MDDTAAALRAVASDVMAIDDVTEGVASPYVVFLGSPPPRPDERGQGVRLRGRLLLAADEAYDRLARRFGALGFTPLLRRDEETPDNHIVLALPGQLRRANQRLGMAGLLFGLTLLSCLFAGAQMVEGLAAVNWNLLDGGHIVYALLGERWARIILWVVLAVLAALAFLWQGWFLWVALIFIFGRMRVAPLDDVTPLTTAQRALALLMLVIFVLIFTPIPMRIVGA
jgi:hypothetical protein